MEIEITLQNAWIHKSGNYHAIFQFEIDGRRSHAKLSSDSSIQIQEKELEWRIGAWNQPAKAVKCVNFGSIQFTLNFPKDSDRVDVKVDLFEEVPVPSTSTSISDNANANMCIGSGVFCLPQGQDVLHLKKPKLPINQPLNSRIFLQSSDNIGGAKRNIGWISFVSEIKPLDESQRILTNESLSLRHISPTLSNAEEDIDRETTDNFKAQSFHQVPSKGDTRSKTSFISERQEDVFPAFDAVKKILPLYHKLLRSPPASRKSVKSYVEIDEPSEPESTNVLNEVESEAKVSSPDQLDHNLEKSKFLDQHVISVMEYQTKEIDRYRQAIRQMGDVIVELRKEISSLEIKNSQLRANLYYADDAVTGEYENAESNPGTNISHTDILKKRLSSKADEVQQQKQKIQELQNSLIEKNEFEKKYLQLRKAHELQQSVLQELQAKVSKYRLLQKTCKDQEKIIEKLEKNGRAVIRIPENTQEKTNSVRFKDPLVKKNNFVEAKISSDEGEIDEVDKNDGNKEKQAVIKTREESLYDEQKWNSAVVPKTKQQKVNIDFDIEERFFLLQKLEKAEGRIMALERQISTNARHWAKEKSLWKLRMAGEFSDAMYTRDPYAPPLPPLQNRGDVYDSYYMAPHRKMQGMEVSPRYQYL